MKVYVVLFYVNYEGYSSDENCKVFKDEEKAKEYIKELNRGYDTKDLHDFYDYEEMELV